jgi:signal peptidase I
MKDLVKWIFPQHDQATNNEPYNKIESLKKNESNSYDDNNKKASIKSEVNQIQEKGKETMSEIKVMDRMAIDIHGDLIEVFPYKDGQKMDKGFGYIHDDHVYIYRGKVKPGKSIEMQSGSVYMNQDKEPLWLDAEDSEEYSVSKIFPLSKEGIYEELQNKDNMKQINPVMLESTDNFFAPRINENDDVLKIIVKKILAELKSNVKPVDGSGKDNKSMSEMVNNLKSNLSNANTRMSILYFAKWMWVLNVKCNIKVEFTNPDGDNIVFDEELRYNYNIR